MLYLGGESSTNHQKTCDFSDEIVGVGNRTALSIDALCRLASRRSQTYLDWRSDGLVAGPRGPVWGHGRLCDVRDAIEFFSLAALVDAFGVTDAKACWKRLRREIVAAISEDHRPVWVIYPTRGADPPQLVRSSIEVAPAAGHGQPVRVTNIRQAIELRLAEFRAKAGIEDASEFSKEHSPR